MQWNFNFLIKLNKNKLMNKAINQVYQCEQTECLNPHVNPLLVFGSSKNSSLILFFIQNPFTYRTRFTIWKMPFKITFLACSEFVHLTIFFLINKDDKSILILKLNCTSSVNDDSECLCFVRIMFLYWRQNSLKHIKRTHQKTG